MNVANGFAAPSEMKAGLGLGILPKTTSLQTACLRGCWRVPVLLQFRTSANNGRCVGPVRPRGPHVFPSYRQQTSDQPPPSLRSWKHFNPFRVRGAHTRTDMPQRRIPPRPNPHIVSLADMPAHVHANATHPTSKECPVVVTGGESYK